MARFGRDALVDAQVGDQLPAVGALTPVYLTDGNAFAPGSLMYYMPDL